MAKAKRAKKQICFSPILRTQKDSRGDRLYIDWPAPISGTGKIRREYFRPADAAAERHARSMEIDAQKTPSRRARDAQRAAQRKRRYLDYYSMEAYRRAVQRACGRAGVPPFTPYQIRKARATEIDRKLGAEAAAIQLGHKSIKTTIDHYIDPRQEQARELAEKIG